MKAATSFSEHIELLRQRPAMFTGGNTITDLHKHLAGYHCALSAPAPDAERFFSHFTTFVTDWYDLPSYAGGWKDIILNESRGNEPHALHTFFELYDAFCAGEKSLPTRTIMQSLLDRFVFDDQPDDVRVRFGESFLAIRNYLVCFIKEEWGRPIKADFDFAMEELLERHKDLRTFIEEFGHNKIQSRNNVQP